MNALVETATASACASVFRFALGRCWWVQDIAGLRPLRNGRAVGVGQSGRCSAPAPGRVCLRAGGVSARASATANVAGLAIQGGDDVA